MRVLMIVKKDILNKVIIENLIDLVSHPHCIVIDIREFNPVSGKFSRKIKVVNFYDNKIDNRCIWQ